MPIKPKAITRITVDISLLPRLVVVTPLVLPPSRDGGIITDLGSAPGLLLIDKLTRHGSISLALRLHHLAELGLLVDKLTGHGAVSRSLRLHDLGVLEEVPLYLTWLSLDHLLLGLLPPVLLGRAAAVLLRGGVTVRLLLAVLRLRLPGVQDRLRLLLLLPSRPPGQERLEGVWGWG